MQNDIDLKANIQTTITKLWELVKNSSETIVELKNENKAIIEQNQLLKNVLDEKEDSSLDLARKNSELLNKIKNLQFDILEKDKMNNLLKEELEDHNSNIAKFSDTKDLIEEKDRHIDELLLENQSLLSEYSQIKTEKNKSEIMLEQYEYQNKNLSQAYVELKHQYADLTEKIDNFNAEMAKKDEEILNYKILQNDYEKLKNSYEDIKKRISELSELTKNHTQLQHKLESIEKENKLLNIKLEKNDQIKEQLEFLRKDSINKNFVIHEKQKEIDSEREKAAQLEKYRFMYEKQKQELQILQNDFEKFEKENTELIHRVEKAETEVNVFDAKYDNLSRKYNKIAEEFYKYEEKYGESRAVEINELNERLNSTIEQNEELTKQISAAKVNIINLKDEKDVTQEQYDKSLAKIEELEHTISEIKELNAKLKLEYEDKESEINKLDNQINSLKNEIGTIKYIEKEAKDLELFNKRLKEEIDALNEEINNKNEEITHFRAKYNEIIHKYKKVILKSESIDSRADYINDMMRNANEAVINHNKYKLKISELETELEKANNNNTIIKLELDKYRNKSEELAQLVRTRYEQIQILEEQLNNKINEQSEIRDEKLKLASQLDKYIQKIDDMLV